MPDQKAQQNQILTHEMLHMLARLDQRGRVSVLVHAQSGPAECEAGKRETGQHLPWSLSARRAFLVHASIPMIRVSRGYRLRLLCQYPQGPHTIVGEERV